MRDNNIYLKPFQSHGITFLGESNSNSYGNCPFCEKEDKFYVNNYNGLWDCKYCGRKGNILIFLTNMSEQYNLFLKRNKRILEELSDDRKLPVEAFEKWNIGYCDGRYSIPIKNIQGYVQDIRMYRLGKKIMSTSGCSVGLLGIHNLVSMKPTSSVYLCEGEWDAIAMQWLLDSQKRQEIVVAVPGANIFKDQWISVFTSHKIKVVYDNDSAGESGEIIVNKKLKNVASGISFLHWTIEFPVKHDIRDLITRVAVENKKPKEALRIINAMLKSSPRSSFGKDEINNEKISIQKITFKDLMENFYKWLYLNNDMGVVVAMATVLSNEFEGDPLWMFLVSPPGGCKTEILNTFSKCPTVYSTSSVTPHSLISGAHDINGKDPSLIPELNNKTLLIKDFSTILSKRDVEKDEIFSILRDAYDGTCGKIFGNGKKRNYISHFTIIAGVTPVIYEMAIQHQSLGERFMKFSIGDNLNHFSEENIIAKAIQNLNKETNMREELSSVVARYVHHIGSEISKGNMPDTTKKVRSKLIALSQWGARMRGIVNREKYRSDIILSKPSAEVGSRLGKNITKFANSIAFTLGKKEIDSEVYTYCKKCMIDTVSQRNEDIIKFLFRTCPTEDDTISTKEIAIKTRYTRSTISRLLADMNILNIVLRSGKSNSYEWTLSKYIRNLIERAELYNDK